MAKNVLQKHWNGSAWVEMHPITKASNVMVTEGVSVANRLADIDALLIDNVKDKKILVFGDSISAYHYGWVDALTDRLAGIATITNMSISGHTITGVNGIASISATITNDYDIIIIFAGVNDYLEKQPLGDINTANDVSTFNGALKLLYANLYTKNNASKVYVVSPTKTQYNPPDNTDFLLLNHYRTILHTHCIYNGWTFIDAYNDAPFLNAFNDLGLPWLMDGLHFSAQYSPYFADYILKAILSGYQSKLSRTVNLIGLHGFEAGLNAYLYYHSDGTARLMLFGEITIAYADTLQPIGFALPTWVRPEIMTSLNITMIGETGYPGYKINKAYAGLGSDGVIYLACDNATKVAVYSDTPLATRNLTRNYPATY
jgi:hypothetical protein